LNNVKNKRWFFLFNLFGKEVLMKFLTRQRWVLLMAAVMAIVIPGITYSQVDLKGKAVETLTNGVMKELDKKFAEMIAKEALSAAVKSNIVKNLSEMSRPIVKRFIDGAASGKLPSQAELVNSVMKDITPRVQELLKVALTDGGNLDAMAVPASVAGSAPAAGQAATAVSYDDEKDFTVEIIKESNSVRITKYAGKNTELKIPPRIGDHPVTEIGERAFVKKGLVSVVIPESVIFIGNLAFAENQIGSVSIGANVYIANNAFENTGYNSFSAGFYNSQGRRSGIYKNDWRWVSAAASQTQTQQTNNQPAVQAASTAPSSGAGNGEIFKVDLSKLSTLKVESGSDAVVTLKGDYTTLPGVKNEAPLTKAWGDVLIILPESVLPSNLSKYTKLTITAKYYNSEGKEIKQQDQQCMVSLIYDLKGNIRGPEMGTGPNTPVKEFNVGGNSGLIHKDKGIKIKFTKAPQAVLFQNVAGTNVAFIEMTGMIFHNGDYKSNK
jgi:hypothetical protein